MNADEWAEYGDPKEVNHSCDAVEFMSDETLFDSTRRKMLYSQRYLKGDFVIILNFYVMIINSA